MPSDVDRSSASSVGDTSRLTDFRRRTAAFADWASSSKMPRESAWCAENRFSGSARSRPSTRPVHSGTASGVPSLSSSPCAPSRGSESARSTWQRRWRK
jgi:hypothetical protein